MVTKEQKEYVMMLECVMPEQDVVVSLKDDDELLRWYLRRSRRGYAHTTQLLHWIDKDMEFWLSVGDRHVDMEAVVMNFNVVVNQNVIAMYRNRLPFYVWSTISSQVGLSQWFIEKCRYRIEWDKLDISQTSLTECFMRRHAGMLNWDDVSLSQKMGVKFMREFRDRLNVANLCRNRNVTDGQIFAVFGNGLRNVG